MKIDILAIGAHPDDVELGCSGTIAKEIAKKQMTGFGAVISFELNKKIDPKTFLKSLKMINPSMSFAGVESTMLSPAETSHYLLTPEDRLAQGITDNLIRFSVGIEDIPDIQNDIEQAFNNCN